MADRLRSMPVKGFSSRTFDRTNRWPEPVAYQTQCTGNSPALTRTYPALPGFSPDEIPSPRAKMTVYRNHQHSHGKGFG
jgi:hypothetical protein